jgi:hypothetical protein
MPSTTAKAEALNKLATIIAKVKTLHYILGSEADEEMVPVLAALRELETRLEQGEFAPKRPYKQRQYNRQH